MMALLSALQQASTPNDTALEQAFGARDVTTPAMNAAIQAWFELYYARHPTDKSDPSQRIPYIVANKLTRTTFSEYEAKTDNAFAKSILDALDKARKKATQQALIGGEALLKPIFSGGTLRFGIIDRQKYLVFGRDETGELTDIGTSELTIEGEYFYTLLERRTVDANGYLTIQSRLFRAQRKDELGELASLNALPKYAGLQPDVTLPMPVGSIGLIPLRTPMENCVDGSEDSVSVYEPAVGLIRLIAINEAQISGEFDRGESRVIVSSDMMDTDELGRRRFIDNIYSALPDGPEEVGITIFSPSFREQSYLARKAEYLRNVEALIGLKRGILSEVEAAERTATEITSSAGDYNLTIIDFQQAWESTVRETVRVCGILGKAYKAPGATEIKDDAYSISWGNGILYDEDKVWEQYRDMVQRGLLKPEIAVAWYFNLEWQGKSDEETAQLLADIRAKYMPEIKDLTDADS